MHKTLSLVCASLFTITGAAFAADDAQDNRQSPAPQGTEEPASNDKAQSPDTADMNEPRVEGDQTPSNVVEPARADKAQEPGNPTTDSTEQQNTEVPAPNNTEKAAE